MRKPAVCCGVAVLVCTLGGGRATGTAPGPTGPIGYVTDNSLVLVDPDATHRREIVRSAIAAIAWTPDGTRFATIQGLALRIGDTTGRLEDPSIDGAPPYPRNPSFAPDGRRLVVASEDAAIGTLPAHLWVLDLGANTVRKLTDSEANDVQPAWSPDGSTIVFTRGALGGGTELYAIAPDGTNLRKLTSGQPYVYSTDADWSPDGKHLAWTEIRHADHQIVIGNSDGTEERAIASAEFADYPSWSPDGGAIVYRSDVNALDVAGVNGSFRGRLLLEPTTVNGPKWRATSRSVALRLADLDLPLVIPRAPFTFSGTLHASGGLPVPNATVAFTFTAPVRVLSATTGCNANAGTVTCALGELAGDATADVFVQVLPLRRGTLRVRAVATPPAGEPNTADDSAEISTVVSRCTVLGSARSERLRGRAGPDVVCALGGNDRIDVRGGGRDIVEGGAGFDTVRADPGDRLSSVERRLR